MQGSEKQIKWAEQIKSTFLEKLERRQNVKGFNSLLSNEEHNLIVATANNKTDAAWWIDHRNDGVYLMSSNLLGRPLNKNNIF